MRASPLIPSVGLGLAVGILAACSDRSDVFVDLETDCDAFCDAEEECFPGGPDTYVNPFDRDGCMSWCQGVPDWEHPECAEKFSSYLACFQMLTCEEYEIAQTVAGDDRSCKAESQAYLNCRSQYGLGEDYEPPAPPE